jgi:hypothetical protein
MVTWTGQGWVGVPLIGAAFWGSYQVFGKDRWHAPLPALVTILVSVAVCYLAGRWLNQDLPKKLVVEQSDEPTMKAHTLVFIPLEYAGIFSVLFFIMTWLDQAGLFD